MSRATLACTLRLEGIRDELSWGQGRRAVNSSDFHATERDAPKSQIWCFFPRAGDPEMPASWCCLCTVCFNVIMTSEAGKCFLPAV